MLSIVFYEQYSRCICIYLIYYSNIVFRCCFYHYAFLYSMYYNDTVFNNVSFSIICWLGISNNPRLHVVYSVS